MIVVYHNDLDGRCSAAIIKQKYPKAYCRSAVHGRPPFENIRYGEEFILVDMTYEPELMKKFSERTNMTWIDHHEKAYDAVQDLTVEGVRRCDKAACMLTWEFYNPGVTPPKVVQIINDYDLFRLDENPDALPFFYGSNSHNLKPGNKQADELWENLLDDSTGTELLDSIIASGKEIDSYVTIYNKHLAEEFAFETEIGKYKVIAINHRAPNSLVFKNVVDPVKHDAMVSFAWIGNSGCWRCSVYQTKPDIPAHAIAELFGGSGHAGAAGFTVEELPFELLPYGEPYTDKFHQGYDDVIEILDKSFIAQKYAASEQRFGMYNKHFKRTINGLPAIIANVPDVNVNIFSNIELTDNKLGISFIWTNSYGWKVTIHQFLKGTIEKPFEFVKDYTDLKIFDDGTIQFYTDMLPFKVASND